MKEQFSSDERVAYTAREDTPPEYGTVTSIGSEYVFVLYDGTQRPKATNPEDLTALSTLEDQAYSQMAQEQNVEAQHRIARRRKPSWANE